MKKVVFFLVFMALTASIFAQKGPPNRHIFIEGEGTEEQVQFFLINFMMEANTLGFTVTERKQDAAFVVKFAVVPDTSYPGTFVLNMGLISNSDQQEVLAFAFFFSDLMEMYEHTQFIFYRATIYIPPNPDGELLDRGWQNKWLYLRTSFNFPITFNAFKPDGLVGGAVYEGTYEDPGDLLPLTNIIMPQPGITIGLEFQFIKFMSLEANFQVSLGNTSTYSFINYAAGTELKFILKGRYLIYQPYGAFTYQLNTSSVFKEYPPMSVGGGMQVAARGGKSGSFFIDVNYMQPLLGDLVKYNDYGVLWQNPDVIYYDRYVIGLGLGYKYGSFDRKRK